MRPAALTVVVLLALAAALFGPLWSSPADEPEVVAVIDVSESVDPASLARRLEELEDRPVARLVAFADHPVSVEDVADLRALPVASDPGAGATGALHRGGSDLASALELAAGSFESDRPRRILLLSDGAQTSGDAFATLPRLLEAGIEVHTRALPTRRDRARLLGVEVAERVRAGEPTRVAVSVLSPLEDATLVLELDGRILDRLPVPRDDDPRSLSADVVFEDPGVQRLVSRLETGDATLHRAERTVLIEPRRSVLLATGSAPIDPLARALESLGWSTTVRPGSALPRDPEGYQPWDAVLLDDVDAQALGPERMAALRAWVVEHGGGLLFASGPSTYGEEGYAGSPLEQILPMRFNVEEEKTDVALMIALDKSYSMRGEKIELAKEAAKAVVRELDPEHRFGVVSFDWNPFKVVPLQEVGDGGDIVERIGRIEASAQTNFYPALEMCREQLASVEAEVKHVILLSDGKTYPDDYEKLIYEMRGDEITISTVAVGTEADRDLLAEIARWGDGTSYFVQDASKVQSILLDEARSKTEQTLVEESVPVRVAGSSPVLEGVGAGSAPALLGRVNLEAAERAEVLLDTEDDRPLLASRSVGLGRIWMTAFDLDGRWTGPWTAWPGFARLVSQALRDAARSLPPARELRLEERGNGVRAVLEARREDGSWENGLDVTLALARRSSDGATDSLPPIPLRQVAPGRYRADLPVRLAGGEELLAEATAPGGPSALVSLLRAVSPEERPSTAASERLLHDLAAATGGSTEGPVSHVLEVASPRTRTTRPLWPALATVALFVYLLELALRRSGLLRRSGPVRARLS
ncbi:MAG TPA: VWA domain-containing protein [Thermoanaerobaculia bacterium]|nr:VWA domain-containing protein [Thermoanaerobaculia bacterium]